MPMDIRTVKLSEFDLSLMEMRIMNYGQALKIERSMAVFGQLQPVVARLNNGRYQLIDGFKRLYAAEILMINTLECQVLDISLVQAKVLLMSYNRSRKTMCFWEEALILQDLIKTHNMDQKQLARLTGRSRSWVSRRLSLISKIDPEVAADLRMGELSASHGRVLMKLPRGNQAAVAHTIMNWKLSTRQSDELVQDWLEAEDDVRRKQILDHPETTFKEEVWEEQDMYPYCNRGTRYDGRLSSFGNELQFYAGEIIKAVGRTMKLIDDKRMEELTGAEVLILQSPLDRAIQCCRRLAETEFELSPVKSIHEHEK